MRHTILVRITHWINAAAFAALVVSGIAILLAHPRFYWGETGYFDTPAAFELRLPLNLDQSGWGRSLHFMAAWIAVINGVIYAVWGLVSGHFRQRFLPAPAAPTTEYNAFQKASYFGVVFILLPLVILTGLTMSPAVTAAFPQLFTVFGGRQSARTLHFLIANTLLIFLIGHVAMTMLTGFTQNMRSITIGAGK